MLSDSFDYSCSFSSEFNTKTTATTIVAAFGKYQCQNWGTLAIILQIQSWLLRSGKRRAWCRLQLYSTWYESFDAIGNLSNWYAALLHLASQHGCVATSRTMREWVGIGEDVHWDKQSATGDIFTSDTKNIACAGCLVVCLLQDVFYLPMGG